REAELLALALETDPRGPDPQAPDIDERRHGRDRELAARRLGAVRRRDDDPRGDEALAGRLEEDGLGGVLSHFEPPLRVPEQDGRRPDRLNPEADDRGSRLTAGTSGEEDEAYDEDEKSCARHLVSP